jgi:2,3-dihydroxy-p-cumate/2,3-dihydroxybenzoate 3,4-dioxygenase
MGKVDFRYRRFGYVKLNVSDIARSTAFATEVFGLDEAGTGPGGEKYFRCTSRHHDIILAPASTPAFVRSGWELETEEDLDKAFFYFGGIGVPPSWVAKEETDSLGMERAFRITEPSTGTVFEYFARISQNLAPLKNHLTSFQGQGHFGLMVPDVANGAKYLVDNLGFLVSDYLEGWPVALLRAFPNPNHHSFAPLRAPDGKVRFHHVAFMVNTIDDIGKLFNRIKRYDVKVQFGIGRHPTSGSIHLYIYDSDYFVWEYTLGMEQFPETGAREPRRMAATPENYDLWNAVPEIEHVLSFPLALVEDTRRAAAE